MRRRHDPLRGGATIGTCTKVLLVIVSVVVGFMVVELQRRAMVRGQVEVMMQVRALPGRNRELQIRTNLTKGMNGKIKRLLRKASPFIDHQTGDSKEATLPVWNYTQLGYVEQQLIREWGPDAYLQPVEGTNGYCRQFVPPSWSPIYGDYDSLLYEHYRNRYPLTQTMRSYLSTRREENFIESDEDEDFLRGKEARQSETTAMFQKHMEAGKSSRVRVVAAPSKMKIRAAVITLTMNSKIGQLVRTLDSFMKMTTVRYPHVFFSNERLYDSVRDAIQQVLCESHITYALIAETDWSIPGHINKTKYEDILHRIPNSSRIPHIKSTSYRLMCRWYAGLFYKHEALKDVDYYWRIDDDIRFLSPIPEDPLMTMATQNLTYGYSMAVWEIIETVPNLMRTVVNFADTEGEDRFPDSWLDFFREPNLPQEYTGCHFWNNLSLGSLSFFRSAEYQSFFEAIDSDGGIFYERWGDAPIITLALASLTSPLQNRYFETISYGHDQYYHVSRKAASLSSPKLEGRRSHSGGASDMSCVEGISSYYLNRFGNWWSS